MRLAGVMGWPISHSLSPHLHGHWLARHGIDGAYLPLAVRPEDFADALRALPKLGFAGCNVTLPHKEEAARLCDDLRPFARKVGAVNTVVIGADGRLTGSNTDGPGFMAHLMQSAPGLQLEGRTVTVLGAGGAARAVVASLLDAGVARLHLVNRSTDKAEALARDLGADSKITIDAWPERQAHLGDAQLLVNTTSLGMTGKAPLEIDLCAMPDGAAVYDLVYAPLQTDLLAQASTRGLVAIDGLGMLLHQAVPGFAAWFGVTPEVDDDLRQAVLAAR